MVLDNTQMVRFTDSIQVSMMLAAPYSGATLLALILDRDPALCCNGEIFSPRPKQDCSCGMLQVECRYYRAVAEHMLAANRQNWNYETFRHTPYYSRSRLINRSLGSQMTSKAVQFLQNTVCSLKEYRQREEEFVAVHQIFIQNCISLGGCQVYVDGSKILRRAEIFAQYSPFELSAIHLVRDGRGFCHSFRKNTGSSDLRVAARRWNSEIRKIDAFRARYPNVLVHSVRYEDLCRDLFGALKDIRRFLNVSDSGPIDLNKSHEDHVIGNRMRRRFDGAVHEDLAWKENIDSASLKKIEAIMEVGLTRYNYL